MVYAALAFDAYSPEMDVLKFFPGWDTLCKQRAPSLREQFGGSLYPVFRAWISRHLASGVRRAKFRTLEGIAPDGTYFKAAIVVTLFDVAPSSGILPAMLSLERVRKTGAKKSSKAPPSMPPIHEDKEEEETCFSDLKTNTGVDLSVQRFESPMRGA